MSLPSAMQTLDAGIEIEDRPGGLLAATFTAMASPCEVLLSGSSPTAARELGMIAAHEAWRIEQKFSRYREDSVVASIHRHRGCEMEVDSETAALLDFAHQCYELSDGMFDITSGVLRRAWKFDGSGRIPEAAAVERAAAAVGLDKLQWQVAASHAAARHGDRLRWHRQGVRGRPRA